MPLPQTEFSARALADCLVKTGALADLPTLMIDATGVACLNAIEDILARSQDSRDCVIVYLASHGLIPTSSQQLYRLATGETRKTDDLIRALPLDEVIGKLRHSAAPLNWLIIDACFSGRAGITLMGPAETISLTDADNLCILASSGPFSASFAPHDQDLTAFSETLVRTLTEGDSLGSEYLSISGIYDQLKSAAEKNGHPIPYLFTQGLIADTRFLPNNAVASAPAPTIAGSSLELTRHDNAAQILFVDDHEQMRDTFQEALESAGHRVKTVGTPDEARECVESTYYDIIVIDLFLVGDLPATELISHLSSIASESTIFVASRVSKGRKAESWTTLSSVFQYPHRVEAFLFKTDFLNFITFFADDIRERREHVLSRIHGLEEWLPFVSGRITRRRDIPDILSFDLEVQARICVEHLVARWFDRDSSVTDYISSMSLERIDSGRSSCSVFSLTPKVQGIEPAGINPLLLKIGPRDEIQQEVSRYDKFVQIGVPLEFRTDKISSSQVGDIGAVIYSLLGQASGSIVEVGELDRHGIAECLGTVFNPETKRWYASDGTGDGIRLLNYFQERDFDVARFNKAADGLQNSLTKMGWQDGGIASDYCEHPSMVASQPTTLVHGDLHLGNILVYGDERYAMIDYRYVGIGPRLMDFVSLEIACWLLADAPDLPRSTLMHDAYTAVSGGGLWHDQSLDVIAPWLQDSWLLARECRRLAGENCKGMTPSEYGCLLWLSAVRRSEFKSTATTAEERRTIRVLPIALALAAQDLVK